MGLSIFSRKKQETKASSIDDVVDYPVIQDLFDLEAIRLLGHAPQIVTEVGEVKLSSGKTVVYSITYSEALLPSKTFLQIEGYKWGSRRVKRFSENEGERVTDEVRENLSSKYDLAKFESIYCL